MKEQICCVCHHRLSTHIDETTGWRCHSLDASLYQCECFLRKRFQKQKIAEYDLNIRTKAMSKDLKRELSKHGK